MQIKINIYLCKDLKNLRLAISAYLNKNNNNNFNSDDIVIGPGTKELMFLTKLHLMEKFYYQHQAGFHTNHKHL